MVLYKQLKSLCLSKEILIVLNQLLSAYEFLLRNVNSCPKGFISDVYKIFSSLKLSKVLKSKKSWQQEFKVTITEEEGDKI